MVARFLLDPRPVAAALLVLATTASVARAAFHHPGGWTQPFTWPATAVNQVLMPDPSGTHHSRIFWFDESEEAETLSEGLWGWTPPPDSAVNAGAYPTAHMVAIPVPEPLHNISCSGMSALADGRILITSGTERGNLGLHDAVLYDPVANDWDAAPDMTWRRWYPTNTILPDGRVLVSSGSRGSHLRVIGGFADAGDSLDRALLVSDADWDPRRGPRTDTGHAPGRPGPIEGHRSAINFGGECLFGGMRPDSSFANDFWMLYRNGNTRSSDDDYVWLLREPEPGWPAPPGRAYHGFAVIDSSRVLVVGGRRGTGALAEALDDAWLGVLIGGKMRWHALAQSGDLPGVGTRRRYGHTAVWEPDMKRVFVYGGASSVGAEPADADVYSGRVFGRDSIRWTRCTLKSGSATPAARVHHASALTAGKYRRFSFEPTSRRRLIVHGGRLAGGALTNQLLTAWVEDTTTVWWELHALTTEAPTPRELHSATEAYRLEKVYVVGGATVASPGGTDGLWSLDTRCSPCAGWPATWTAHPPRATPARGHSATYDLPDSYTRVGETYDPAANAFTEHSQHPLLQEWYPQMFLLPGGPPWRVFNSGPSDTTYMRVLSDGPGGGWTSFPSVTSGFRGGSAVMYRVGKVMKCGSRDTDAFTSPARGTTKLIDLNAATPQWVNAADTMLARCVFNLTLLPDGKVLATGGQKFVNNNNNANPVRRPEIWDPDANGGLGHWDGATVLDTSTVLRGYHSTALLLPDGRVLCAGGFETIAQWGSAQLKGDMYSPPYLFNADGTPASRPVVIASPAQAGYAQVRSVSVATDSTNVSRFVLMRPGSVTHGYDQSQRWIPLEFERVEVVPSSHQRFEVVTPADSTIAPPGDYMLFALNAQGTPSIARWVRVTSGAGATVSVRVAPPLASLALEAVRPNPAGESFATAFTLPRAARARVEVFDVAGRRLALLLDAPLPAGRHEHRWRTDDATRGRREAGVYLLRVTADGRSVQRRFVLLD